MKEAPFNVLFLIESLNIGGSEAFLERLLRRLDSRRFRPVVCCLIESGTLAEQVEARGIPVITLEWRVGAVLSTLSVFFRLVRLMRRERIELVQSFFYRPEILGVFASRLAGVPVFIASQQDVMLPAARLPRFLWRAASLFVNHVIANSRACSLHRDKATFQRPRDVSVIHIGLFDEAPTDGRAAEGMAAAGGAVVVDGAAADGAEAPTGTGTGGTG
ncbi:MAG: glycosyltransferase, partial [Candidatus Eisenbacteria bacterium]